MAVSDEERLEALFNECYGDVLAYAIRRSASRQDAEDVVAETFAVAWRRHHDLPEGDDARLWLFGTARLIRMNGQRAHRRQQRLLGWLRGHATALLRGEAESDVAAGDRLEQALADLNETDREILQPQAWDCTGFG